MPNTKTPEPLEVVIDADLDDLVPVFLTNRRKDVEIMRGAYRNGEQDRIQRVAHRIMGTAGSYGFDLLSQLAEELEKGCMAHDTARIPALIDAIDDYLNRVRITWS